MHINRHLLFVVGLPALLVLIALAAGMYHSLQNVDTIYLSTNEQAKEVAPQVPGTTASTSSAQPVGDVSNDTVKKQPSSVARPTHSQEEQFSGVLTKVHTGCFVDGECFVVVDGKHVTLMTGERLDANLIWGQVVSPDGIGGLEAFIGKTIDVKALRTGTGTYTLKGDASYYVRAPKTFSSGCIVGGCSAQLCVDASHGDVMSTCEWTEAYACYGNATCERQQNGQCGWTETPELTQCLSSAGKQR